MNIKSEKKELLFQAWAFCDEAGQSTEFMIQYMQDTAKVDHNTVIDFIMGTTDEDLAGWYKDIKNNKTNE